LSLYSDSKMRPGSEAQRSVSRAQYKPDLCETFDVIVTNPPFGISLSSEVRKKLSTNLSLPETSYPKAFTSSLRLISTNYALRCDAKYADSEVIELEKKIRDGGFFYLGDYIASPILKGGQMDYIEQPTDDSVPIVNTLSIQNLKIRVSDCRHVVREDYDALSSDRQLRPHDVLLTVDGGVSIGKPVLFDLAGPFSVDSHVAILRPTGIAPFAFVYLLASPLAQMQFRRFESGASGQTTVTEDDFRRFVFPKSALKAIDAIAEKIEKSRQRIGKERLKLDQQEADAWRELDALIP
jgi:hypothetical protein